jgi:hypothetical protein
MKKGSVFGKIFFFFLVIYCGIGTSGSRSMGFLVGFVKLLGCPAEDYCASLQAVNPVQFKSRCVLECRKLLMNFAKITLQ